MAKQKFSYKSAIEELELILEDIENENLDIDLLSEKVKRADVLIKECKKKLKSTENEIEKVLEDFNSEE